TRRGVAAAHRATRERQGRPTQERQDPLDESHGEKGCEQRRHASPRRHKEPDHGKEKFRLLRQKASGPNRWATWLNIWGEPAQSMLRSRIKVSELPSLAELLAFIRESPSAVGAREIGRAFGVAPHNRAALRNLLCEIERSGEATLAS